MTGNTNFFYYFQLHVSTSSVALADGSPSHVVGSGTITPTNMLHLSYVLHLPNLSLNLISISQLTRHLYCSVSFFFLIIAFIKILWWKTLLVIDMNHEVSTFSMQTYQRPRLVLVSRLLLRYIAGWVILLFSCSCLQWLFPRGNPSSLVLHHHLPSKALFLRKRLSIPSLLNSFCIDICSQENKWIKDRLQSHPKRNTSFSSSVSQIILKRNM